MSDVEGVRQVAELLPYIEEAAVLARRRLMRLGYQAGRHDALHHAAWFLVAIALAWLCAGVMLGRAIAAPRPSSQPASVQPSDLSPAHSAMAPGSTGAPPPRAELPASPERPEGGGELDLPPLGARAGWATWYDAGPGRAAAPWYAYGDGNVSVRVCRQDDPDRCVDVVVQDFCACGDRRGRPTVIDLDRRSFAALAAPADGIVLVTVRLGGARP